MTAAPRRRSALGSGAAVVLLALALAGCERLGELAPFTTVSNPAESGAGSVTVAKGDSAYLISRRYNVPLRDLIEINGLKPPYTLEVGQRLTLPTSRQYIVQKGDSLYTVSRMFNVDSSELSQLNNLAPPYKLTVGQPLRLPGARAGEGGAAVAHGGASADSTSAPTPIAAAPLPPVSPRAGKGGIAAAELPPPSGAPASSAPAPAAAAAAASAPSADSGGGEENHTFQPGQEPKSLRAPGAKPTPPAPLAAPSVIPPEAPASKPQPTPAAKPAEVAAAPAAAPAAPPAPPAAAEEEPPARAGSRFLWPVKGKVISGYGPKPDGMHNDGLNIAANKGTPVIAADNGIVAYSGNELRGFGNLLLVKHADGWITAYAHLDTMSVERGAKVKRGQVIGTVGQTGAVTSPQLHFELRRGSQAIDPRGHLQGGKVSALPLDPAVNVAALPGRD